VSDEKHIILSEIRRLQRELGRAPGLQAFSSATGIPAGRIVGRYWARWSDALVEAGFAANELTKRYDSTELLRGLADHMRSIGRYPSVNDLKIAKRNGLNVANSHVYPAHFGTAPNLRKALRKFCSEHDDFIDLLDLIPVDNVVDKRQSNSIHGHVYLLQSGEHYKIGRSDNLERRIKEISIALPAATKLIHSIATDDPVGIEAYWHRRFADRRANGEWFKLTRDDLAAFRRRKFQ
jgi:hypothetical protein